VCNFCLCRRFELWSLERLFNRILLICLFVFLSVGSALAAPPKVDHLFPAGGKRGETVTVAVTGSLGSGKVHAWCNRKSVVIKVDTKSKKLSVTISPETIPGPCRLRLYNAEGASALKSFIIGTVEEINEKEPNNQLSQAQRLKSSVVVVNGVLSKNGEVDTFAVELKKGQTVVASMLANRTLGSPMDGVLQIVSPRGFVLEQNDDEFGFDPQIAFTAEEDGLYYIRTFAFPAMPNSSIRFSGASNYIYRLTISTAPFVDHAIPLAINRGAENISQTFGWNIPQDFSNLSISIDRSIETAVLYHPEMSNTLPIQISSLPIAVEKEPNTADVPQAVSVPSVLTGRIESPGDVDSYRFSAKKSEKLLFRVESRKLGYPLDPVLRLYDSAGKLLKEQDTRSQGVFDELLAYTIPADGNYRLEVADLYSAGGLRYVYLLTIEPQQPGYNLALKVDAFQLTPGKPLEIPVTVNREYGLKEEIEISIPGLPKGVVVKPVLSKSTGASAKLVKLILKANASVTFNGPVQCVGRSSGDKPLKRVAVAPIPNISEKTRELWLTVLPAKPVEAAKPSSGK